MFILLPSNHVLVLPFTYKQFPSKDNKLLSNPSIPKVYAFNTLSPLTFHCISVRVPRSHFVKSLPNLNNFLLSAYHVAT